MLNRVMFVSRTAAENTAGMPKWAVISVSEPDSAFGQAKLMQGWYSILRVSFHDVDPHRYEYEEPYEVMDADDAAAIVAFVESVAPHVDGVLVHCKAGISRSAAVAKWIAKRYGLTFNHQYSQYNQHVYQMLVEAAGK